jgi:hypothetical protein
MLTFFALILFLILFPAFAENVESAFTEDFDGWGNWKSANSVVQFVHDPDVGRTDPGSLSIILGAGHPDEKSVCFLRRLVVEPSKTYTGLVFVKTEGVNDDATISLGFQGQDAKGNFLGTGVQSTRIKGRLVKSGEWKRLVYTIRVPDTGKWQNVGRLLCTVGISHSEKGQVWFDDFQFFLNP